MGVNIVHIGFSFRNGAYELTKFKFFFKNIHTCSFDPSTIIYIILSSNF
jgi:hypothetical protein